MTVITRAATGSALDLLTTYHRLVDMTQAWHTTSSSSTSLPAYLDFFAAASSFPSIRPAIAKMCRIQ